MGYCNDINEAVPSGVYSGVFVAVLSQYKVLFDRCADGEWGLIAVRLEVSESIADCARREVIEKLA